MYTPRLSLVALSAVLCLGAQQVPPPPTFRSAVDLLTIETSVRDKSGAAVPDLQTSDFTVTIDGKPRKVVSAQFFKTESSGPRLLGGAPPTPRHLTNEEAAPGRVVVFAVDSDSIRRGQEKALFETASRMLDALSPSDAVGLVEMPGASIDVTRDHAGVAETLKRFAGRKPSEMSNIAMTYAEAEAIERGDTATDHAAWWRAPARRARTTVPAPASARRLPAKSGTTPGKSCPTSAFTRGRRCRP